MRMNTRMSLFDGLTLIEHKTFLLLSTEQVHVYSRTHLRCRDVVEILRCSMDVVTFT